MRTCTSRVSPTREVQRHRRRAAITSRRSLEKQLHACDPDDSADSQTTDENELQDDYDIVQAEAMTCQSTPEMIPKDTFAFHGNLMKTEQDMVQYLNSRLAKKKQRAATKSRERTAELLKIPSELTTRCTSDTKKTQLVTRSGSPRLACCVCHLHHMCAMKSPASVREFLKKVLEQVCHFKVDDIAGDAQRRCIVVLQKSRLPRSIQFLSCCPAQRDGEVNTGHTFESKLHIAYSTNNHPSAPRSR